MNEQDFKQWLRSETDMTPIPDHLSPEHMAEQLNQERHKKKWYQNPWMNLAAACLLVTIIGTSVWAIRYGGTGQNSSMADMEANSFMKDTDSFIMNEESIEGPSADNSYQSKGSIQTAGSYRQLYQLLNRLTISYHYGFIDISETLVETEDWITSGSDDAATSIQNSAASQDRENVSYYDTNSQVGQVAEADVVKTDGVYIYSCYRQNGYSTNAVAIAKADNGALKSCSIISPESITEELHCDDFYIQEMYIVNQRLILLCQVMNTGCYETYILTYNVSKPEQPELLSSLMQEGYYSSSRFANGYLYTFSQKWKYDVPKQYEAYDDYVPHTDNKRLTCNDIYIPECPDSSCYQIMTAMELNDPDHFTSSKAILSGYGTYYVSENNIYFAQQGWEQGVATTELLKFHYKDGIITPSGSVTFAGYLLNQFSMDEYNGYLRVAATVTPAYVAEPMFYDDSTINQSALTGATDDTTPSNNNNVRTNALYIIDSDMNLVGKIDNLAPDERIYSVRFMGDTGYFVTYRETDPLFSVDLSDPTNPKVMDALKIPGFSTYLHFYSEDLLFGLGEEINPITGEFMGLKLSMFDISDPYHITEIDKTVLSDVFYSTALYNHKALMIDPERNLIGFHTECYDDNTYESHEQYVIYSYVEGTGFRNQFTYNISEDATFSEYIEVCGLDAYIMRGLYIGDYLYLVYGNRICSYSLDGYDKIDALIIQADS